MPGRILAILLVLGFLTYPAVAMAIDTQATCEELTGKNIRVRTLDKTESEGELVWCYGDSLYVTDGAGTHTVFYRDVDSLWVRGGGAGSKTEKGIILGVLLGGLAGGLAAEMRAAFCEGECGENTSTAEGALYGALVGAALGGIFGAASGGGSDEWSLWYGSDGETACRTGRRRSGIEVGLMLPF